MSTGRWQPATPGWELALWHLAELRDSAVGLLTRQCGRDGGSAARQSWPRRQLRRLLLLAWWTVTLQLPRHFGWWLAARRLRRLQPVTGALPALPAAVPDPDTLVMPSGTAPVVSVIVTGYGKTDHTLRCLGAIAANPPAAAIEVIVMDDASGDPAVAELARVRGLRLVVNSANLGYLRSCNAAARLARGAFLLFLNNDTYMAAGALDAMLATFRDRDDVGAVGAMLLFPDGRLQEAGGIIWRDGTGCNYGRGDDPNNPVYNYARAVDYCSGAALMVPKALFASLGGFDERFAPAYYEDTDLAFRLRRRGYRVMYQPRARVVHTEGVSHGTDLGTGVKAFQATNRQRFTERWGAVLATEHFPPGERVLRAREHAGQRPVVLVIDHYVPEPDRDAGSANMLNYIKALLASDAVVKFWPHNRCYSPGYTEALQDLGVEVLHGGRPDGFADWIGAHGGELDHVLLSRPDVAAAHLGPLKRHSAARLIYYGVDLHFRRLRMQARVSADFGAAREADRIERIERWIWRSVDVVLYPSEEEATVVAGLEPSVTARAVPAFCFDSFADSRLPPPGHDILFVGGFAHPPNEHAVRWLADEIMPLIRARVPTARLVVAGSQPGPRVLALAEEGAAVLPDVSAEMLRRCYATARIAAVPLRFGAGVKMKTAEALREGTPLVTTSVGAQGMPELERIVPPTDSPAEFAAAACRLLTDDALWRARCDAQIAFARHRFSEAGLRERFLAAAGITRPPLAAAA